WVPAWIGGRVREARCVARAALDADGDLSSSSRAPLLAGAGWFALWQSDQAEGEPMLREALAVGRSCGDDETLAPATPGLRLVAEPGRVEESARSVAQESADLSRRRGDRWGEAAALTMKGVILARQGDFEGNRELFEDALSMANAVDDGHLALIAEVSMATYL